MTSYDVASNVRYGIVPAVTSAAWSAARPAWSAAAAAAATAASAAAAWSRSQGLTIVHFSAQLEPCLSQESTLHTLNTP